ncbi:hypothetical protein R3P38DRAFT_2797681 [Favolaschia claudopus]|uniref:Uncharacterized protein n=1 Tax=Favolaschia claudopus TaxID=2862362 RepID=A0AAW0A2Y5_9AGAR
MVWTTEIWLGGMWKVQASGRIAGLRCAAPFRFWFVGENGAATPREQVDTSKLLRRISLLNMFWGVSSNLKDSSDSTVATGRAPLADLGCIVVRWWSSSSGNAFSQNRDSMSAVDPPRQADGCRQGTDRDASGRPL